MSMRSGLLRSVGADKIDFVLDWSEFLAGHPPKLVNGLEQDTEKAKEEGLELPLSQAGVVPYIRPLNMADMRQAMDKVSVFSCLRYRHYLPCS